MFFTTIGSQPGQEAPPPSFPGGQVGEAGIAIALLTIILQQGSGFLKNIGSWVQKKDAEESALTASLITDLRDANKDRSEKIVLLQERTVHQLTLINESLKESGDKLNEVIQTSKKDSALLLVEMRQQSDRLIIVEQSMKALHERFDRWEIPK